MIHKYLREVTDLEDKIKQATKKGHFNGEHPYELIRLCCECMSLISVKEEKPILLTEFQSGYLYALMNKGHKTLTHSYCANCYDEVMKAYREMRKQK